MTNCLQDYLLIDGSEDPTSELEYYSALQRQINSGLIWKMQGSAGRAAMDAIKAGYCLCGHKPAADYWGSIVPSRDDLQAGTFGTIEYVAQHHGNDYAIDISAIE